MKLNKKNIKKICLVVLVCTFSIIVFSHKFPWLDAYINYFALLGLIAMIVLTVIEFIKFREEINKKDDDHTNNCGGNCTTL